MTAARPPRRAALTGLALLLTAAGLLAGCQRFTRQNYETIYVGESAEGVRNAIGAPDEIRGSTWRYVHEKPEWYAAEIDFAGGKVTAKRWLIDRGEMAEN